MQNNFLNIYDRQDAKLPQEMRLGLMSDSVESSLLITIPV